MDDIPTSDDQYTLLSEEREFFPEIIVPVESLGIIETHSDNWNISLRKKVDKCRPDTMIESSSMISPKYMLTSLFILFPSFLRPVLRSTTKDGRQESVLLFMKYF